MYARQAKAEEQARKMQEVHEKASKVEVLPPRKSSLESELLRMRQTNSKETPSPYTNIDISDHELLSSPQKQNEELH